jgi:HD-GYP domain-containing protein (c-di-GMP phosphodiesterase class II)/pSer/pThr/pTyr-binding forkhead associated (FHA) protein
VRFEFVVRGGRDTGRVIAVNTGQMLTIGRLDSCDVTLDDDAVSRRHCMLHAAEARCTVADLNSANGTFVNERRIQRAELVVGDALRIGATVIELSAAVPRDTTRPGAVTTTSLTLSDDDHGRTVVRKAIDPSRPAFLARRQASSGRDDLLEAAQRYLSTLHGVSEALSRAGSREALCESILSAILDAIPGDRAAILVRREGAGEQLEVAALRIRSGAATSGDIVLSRTVVRDVLEQGISAFSADALVDRRYGGGKSVVRQQIRSVMCAPVRTTESILGALYVDSRQAHEFDEASLELLAAIGNQAGVALHRARLLAEIETLFLDTMKAIAAIIDAKDGYTHRHSERVAAFAVRLAEELGLAAEERAAAELAGLLHDVGKIGVPDAILNKPEALTASEVVEMRRHPAHGAAILSHIQSARIARLLPGVKYHHERWDGSGYPDGLRGEEIPLIGRILAVADVLDALSSDRAYRRGRPLDEVVRTIQEEAGRAFDPEIAAAAARLHARGRLALPIARAPVLSIDYSRVDEAVSPSAGARDGEICPTSPCRDGEATESKG